MKSLRVRGFPRYWFSVLGWCLARTLLTMWTRVQPRLDTSSSTPESE
jgi:hypothetical protein